MGTPNLNRVGALGRGELGVLQYTTKGTGMNVKNACLWSIAGNLCQATLRLETINALSEMNRILTPVEKVEREGHVDELDNVER